MTTQESDLIRPKLQKTQAADLSERLEAWFARNMPDAGNVRLTALNAPSSGAGFSGDTYIATVQWQDGAGANVQKFVLRAEMGAANCPESNFGKMVKLQTVLGEQPALCVPKVYWSEADTSVLGGPFYAMAHEEGRVAPDSPPFSAEGWVHDATAEQRTAMYRSGIAFLAKLHALDWKALGLNFLMHEGQAELQTRRHLDLIIGIYDKAMEGQRSGLGIAAIRWLEKNIPASESLSISWGDARLGNMLWRDYQCVAALDWEMCTLAEPASDLAWWMFFERSYTEGLGIRRPQGMPSRDEMIAMYEKASGKPLANFPWHEVFTGFRAYAIATHMARVWERAGQKLFGPEGSSENNPVANTFRELMAGYA